MTISSTDRKAGPFIGNDGTTDFPFTFKVFSTADLYVVKSDSVGAETELILTTDFTVALNADQDNNPGGTLTLPAALATGYNLTITSDIAALQPVDLTNGGGFYPTVINTAFDRMTMLIQQIAESVSRSLKFSVSTPSGEITELTSADRANKAIGFDPFGQLTTLELSAGTSLVDLGVAAGSSLIGHQPTTGAATTVQLELRSHEADLAALEADVAALEADVAALEADVAALEAENGQTVSVIDFGADPTGATDSTAAFNLATQSTVAGTGFNSSTGLATDTFPKTVRVPAGQYRISGAVYIHKGQHLKGDGEGVTRILLTTTSGYGAAIFRMGYSTLGEDSGGLAPEISGMWMYGGPSAQPVIEAKVSGYSIHNLFITSCGDGISVLGTDGRVNNVQIDQAYGAGINIGGHNHTVTNVLMYLPYYGFVTKQDAGSVCVDIAIDNCQIYYPKYNGIKFMEGVTHHNIRVSDSIFDLNEQFATFSGYVSMNCNYATGIVFSDCSFNNMKGPAYDHVTGLDNEVTFNNCVFDGNKSVGVYAQSTTAYAIKSENEDVLLYNCQFRNLLAEPIAANGGAATTRITVEGGVVYKCAGTTMFAIGATAPTSYAGFLYCNNVFFQDEPTSAFPATTGWNLGTTHGHVLPGNGATAIAMRPTGRKSTYFVNTTSAAAKVTLPRNDINGYHTPKQGDRLTFIDYAQTWNTNNVTFERGPARINGAAADYVASVNGATLVFTYNSVTNDWNVKA